MAPIARPLVYADELPIVPPLALISEVVMSVYPLPWFGSDCVRIEPQAAFDCSCTTPIRSPTASVTAGLSVTSLRPLTALNGPRVATTWNAATDRNAWRRMTILNAFEHVPLQLTLALLIVPATGAVFARFTYVAGATVVIVAVPP